MRPLPPLPILSAAELTRVETMSNALIINARHHLSAYQRFTSNASTAMLWGGWLWMWRPLLNVFNWVNNLGANVQPTLLKLMATGTPMSLEGSVMALIGASGTLLLWNMLPAQKARTSAQTPLLRDYADYFELPELDILSGRASNVCTVHHDETGRITRIESQDWSLGAEAVQQAA